MSQTTLACGWYRPASVTRTLRPAAGAICRNVYLYAASNGVATVIRAWIDRDAIAQALGLTHAPRVLFSQTVGYPKR